MIGWVAFPYPNIPPEEINDPSENFLKAYKEGKIGIMHFFDDYRKSMCGKANLHSSVMDERGKKQAFEEITPEVNSIWYNSFILCPECDKNKPEPETSIYPD